MRNEKNIFNRYIEEKNLKRSGQREAVLDVFLSTDKHLSVEELHNEVKKNHPKIGFTTVYRTIKLLTAAGLCREVHFKRGITHYEQSYGQKHHDHLLCTKCGKCIEILDSKIEVLQDNIFKSNNFLAQGHSMVLYGICPDCQKK